MAQQYKIGTVATSVATDEGVTRITYHSTVVVKFDDDKITLNSGGWKTSTTKTRMNQSSNQLGLRFRVAQKDYEWFVELPNGRTVEFKDGMEFNR